MAARAAREALSDAESANLKLTLADGRDVDVVLTRAEFEALAQPLVERTLDCARRALRDASLKAADVRGVVMVGGATRMPVVRAAVGRGGAGRRLASQLAGGQSRAGRRLAAAGCDSAVAGAGNLGWAGRARDSA
ncbi:hypothetical protein G6F35_017745 [Rhizopus arrhizus]|nr:hypothetical protein G6F35_017745 [Rhizopus arrhizus]